MSLREVYALAHTAECRLHMAAGRPERDLRFVVGHLMHYESLRLRIVEIEHDISKSERAQAVHFQGTGHVNGQQVRHKASTGQLGRKSPPYIPPAEDEPEVDDDEGVLDDDEEEDDDLGLTRFPSGSTRPPPLELDHNNEDDEDDLDEPVSPEEPDQATIEKALKGQGGENLTQLYESVRKCPCHGHSDAPSFDRMWAIPSKDGDKTGVTRMVAEVAT